MSRIHLDHCPVCTSADISKIFSARDHTVSGEKFDIWQCGSCTARFTQDVPGPEDIGLYYRSEDYISHSDTQKGVVNRLYHYARNIALRQKKTRIISATGRTTGSLLDIGCGTGAFLHFMKRAGWQVTGLEPDQGAREKAHLLYGLEVLPAGALCELGAGQYHAITLWHVLEHVHRLEEYLDQIKKLLAPGGLCFIAVPNYTSLDAGLYREFWAAYDVPRHLYHFSPQAMQELISRRGCTIIRRYPMVFDAFYVSLLSEKYRSGKTRFFAGIKNGLRSWLYALSDPSRCSSVVYVIRPEAAQPV